MSDSKHGIELLQAAAGENLMAQIIGDWAKGHGFDEDWELAYKLEALAMNIMQDGPLEPQGDLTPVEVLTASANALRLNIVAAKLMLIVSEVAEALESLRDTGVERINEEGNLGEELADAEIRIKHLANLLAIDLGHIQVAKIKANANRPYKHGRVL